jgi:hypothetical protein
MEFSWAAEETGKPFLGDYGGAQTPHGKPSYFFSLIYLAVKNWKSAKCQLKVAYLHCRLSV